MHEAKFIISGLVQGVFYRAHAKKEAEKLNLKGVIQNMPDGTVCAILQGEKLALEQFGEWAETGSPSAKVDKVEAAWQNALGEYKDVQIK